MTTLRTSLTGLLVSLACIGASPAFAATYCDNDRDPSQYPHCSNAVYYGTWVYRSGQSGDWNGDDRLASSGFDNYAFIFDSAASYKFYAWLANAAFTAPAAEYSVWNDQTRITSTTINQNTAPSGWNYLLAAPGKEVDVARDNTSGSVGADIVKIVSVDSTATQSSSADDIDQSGHCPSPAIDDPSITSIQEKMLNAVDHYHNVQGTYRVTFANNGQSDRVDFQVSEPDHRSMVRRMDRTGHVTMRIADGANTMTYLGAVRQFQKSPMPAIAGLQGPRVYRNTKCEPVYVHREDPAAAGDMNDITLPENYAFWLSTATSRIVGHDDILGRHATEIQGQPDPYLMRKLGATAFTMWVDDQTGVLLKLVGTDDTSTQVYSIDVADIQFDASAIQIPPISPPPAGWTAVTHQTAGAVPGP
jgi:hypothetical protein